MPLNYKKLKVNYNKKLANNIYEMSVEGSYDVKPGQFFMLRAWGNEPVLSRPLSIYDANENELRFLYQVKGRGTKIFEELQPGQYVEVMGPLGNTFEPESYTGKVAFVAGGIGIAPFIYLAKSMKVKPDFYAGFRNEVYSIDELKEYVNDIYITTEDGSAGSKGYVTGVLKPENYDLVVTCGPEIMMKKVVQMCREKNVKSVVSMEQYMACGIGACLVCTCETKYGMKRVCKDGPIFGGEEIVIDA